MARHATQRPAQLKIHSTKGRVVSPRLMDGRRWAVALNLPPVVIAWLNLQIERGRVSRSWFIETLVVEEFGRVDRRRNIAGIYRQRPQKRRKRAK